MNINIETKEVHCAGIIEIEPTVEKGKPYIIFQTT